MGKYAEFVSKIKVKEQDEEDKNEKVDKISLIEETSEIIMSKHRFLTIEESKEMLYYRDGVYVPGGEVLVEKEAETCIDIDLPMSTLSEIKGHIMRHAYRTDDEIDSDLNIINLKNGLYNIRTGEFKEHSPDYLSINQVTVPYNPKAKSKLFGKFLCEVLYPSEIRTAIELIAYTFYRDNPFEIITILLDMELTGNPYLLDYRLHFTAQKLLAMFRFHLYLMTNLRYPILKGNLSILILN